MTRAHGAERGYTDFFEKDAGVREIYFVVNILLANSFPRGVYVGVTL